MASSSTVTKKCVTCMQNSDEHKIKPGITLCEGCHQTYCLPHIVEHRQALNKTLDDIAGQRNILRSRIDELPTRMSNEHLKTINDWKKTMLQAVTEATKNAQHQVHELVIGEMERECSELTNKITSFQVNGDCFETDLDELQTKIEKLNEVLNDLSSLCGIQLNLPTLDCSNMVHIKPLETPSLAQTAKNNDSIISQPRNEYCSFIERFLRAHTPLVTLSAQLSTRICASPTMLIETERGFMNNTAKRFIFHRELTSTFAFESGTVLEIQWSHWLQEFIILMDSKIMVIDALEKRNKVVVEEKQMQLQCMNHWKSLCLVTDNTNRVFCYEMQKNSGNWLLLYCWSVPTTCAVEENITAIGINEHHIVLSIQGDNQYNFAVHNHDMTRCSNIELFDPCMSIQALPQGEWLLYDSSEQLYYVIDSELEQHDELYLSSLKGIQLTINCEETGKILLVLLSPDKNATYQKGIRVYMNDYPLFPVATKKDKRRLNLSRNFLNPPENFFKTATENQ